MAATVAIRHFSESPDWATLQNRRRALVRNEALRVTALRLVTDEPASDSVVYLGDTSAITRVRALLASEAQAFEAQYGKNPYSDYLLKYHRRPDAEEAAAIGRLIGGRVEAADGCVYPPLSKADRRVLGEIKARRKTAARRYNQILRLRSAIALLAQNEDDPADLIACGSILFDCPEIANQMELARGWLNRFAREWSRGKEACTGDAEQAGCAQVQNGS
jgi:hypothetical protein